MPAPDSFATRSLTLPNGLNVSLCSAPRLKRCAGAVRVAAGSHDVSGRWPGLAHFLEHLFFLGTERFPAGQNLMAFVQRHGGQLNASTRERTTDFFFELPPAVFAAGLERMCEMLANPRMAIAEQLREREVLHAEFIAWSRDAASQAQFKRLQGINSAHPLRGFHAGNRFSLPVPRPAFQQALQGFYQRFYQAGQMTLSLAGPQSLDALEILARAHGSLFAQGHALTQTPPPALVDQVQVHHFPTQKPEADPRRIHLTFACEGLPEGHQRASDFVITWLNNEQYGGLVAELRERGLVESLKAEVIYQFGGQVLLDVEVVGKDAVAGKRAPTDIPHAAARLPAMTSDPTPEIYALIFNWLTFFTANFRQLLKEYTLLEQRKLQVGSAMTLARHYSGATDQADLSVGISALLSQLTPATLVNAAQISAPPENIKWQLPRPNPFLRPSTVPLKPAKASPSLNFSSVLPAQNEGAVYLRWTLPSPQPTLAKMLISSLEPLIADAEQAGVSLTFSSYSTYWQLKLTGLIDPLPAVMEHALHLLSQPDADTLARYGQVMDDVAPMPIRQLIKTLPDHFLNNPISTQTRNLQGIWDHAHWTGLATGFDGAHQNATAHVARLMPGNPQGKPKTRAVLPGARRWQVEPSASSEDAVLVFYPLPSPSVEDEAAGRLLAQMIQSPFYQRLRVELQLGYAVFSGLRQMDGQSGLLFGVQSPSVQAQHLVHHIEGFLGTAPALIEHADLGTLITAQQDQLRFSHMDSSQAAELLWQAYLAGFSEDYPERLQHSLAHLQKDTLLSFLEKITRPDAARLCLSNRRKVSEAQ